ncbi:MULTISPECIES: OsmC family protein [unclassified Sphingomonas]|uniref:OsmC family protein n=1 Tax=unclassified Sphingomonas TaxID=196159 RepID=UPI0009273E8F|nr:MULTISPECIES: OsmC family protein [unclassified Sphingomonas]MBN8848271.1 OsmC family protein [Sphingomonas sp.]OJV33876.1 MAG: osmotically inducible protein OsmC [Sphingomonas sp. 67-36]
MAERTVARVRDAQGSPLAVAIEVSGHHLFGDEPVGRGGANLGPTPYDLLTAALAQCTAMTVRWYAGQHGWPLEHVAVEVEHGKRIEAGGVEAVDAFRKTVTVTGPALTGEQKAKLIEIAGRCPVDRTLTGTIRIETLAG